MASASHIYLDKAFERNGLGLDRWPFKNTTASLFLFEVQSLQTSIPRE
jgi:hypothetical protein